MHQSTKYFTHMYGRSYIWASAWSANCITSYFINTVRGHTFLSLHGNRIFCSGNHLKWYVMIKKQKQSSFEQKVAAFEITAKVTEHNNHSFHLNIGGGGLLRHFPRLLIYVKCTVGCLCMLFQHLTSPISY